MQRERYAKLSQLDVSFFQHMYKDIPVLGSMAVVTESPITHESIRNKMRDFHIAVTPDVSITEALSIAHKENLTPVSLPTLAILPDTTPGSAHLVYMLSMRNPTGFGNEDLIIDAHTGHLVAELSHMDSIAPFRVISAENKGLLVQTRLHYPQILTLQNIADCSATDLATQNVSIFEPKDCLELSLGHTVQRDAEGKEYCQIIDHQSGRPMEIHPDSCTPIVGNNHIFTAPDTAAANAIRNAERSLAYFYNHFGRDSFDGKGSELVSLVHVGKKMANAYWFSDMNILVFGDGNAEETLNFANALDVTGHEITHGINHQTANLIMMRDSGALSESFSDFFGKMIENNNTWIIGEAIYHDHRGLRNLETPGRLVGRIRDRNDNLVPTPYPEHTRDKAITSDYERCDSSNDFCWIHYNSTIPSHAAYLVTRRIGKHKAELLYYTVLTQKLTAFEDFHSAAEEIINTCSDLGYSQSDCTAVRSSYEQTGMLD